MMDYKIKIKTSKSETQKRLTSITMAIKFTTHQKKYTFNHYWPPLKFIMETDCSMNKIWNRNYVQVFVAYEHMQSDYFASHFVILSYHARLVSEITWLCYKEINNNVTIFNRKLIGGIICTDALNLNHV